jgi:hypothetical protein
MAHLAQVVVAAAIGARLGCSFSMSGTLSGVGVLGATRRRISFITTAAVTTMPSSTS